MADAHPSAPVDDLPHAAPAATAVLVLADGTVFRGRGLGAARTTVGEVCFNTSMTGYQEIVTDPSYAGQIITFTFPHIGNVGANRLDVETVTPHCLGLILRADLTQPSNHRAERHFDCWLSSVGLPGMSGVDTRRLTRRIRDGGAPSGVLCHAPDGVFDLEVLRATAARWPGLEGMDLASTVSCTQSYLWDGGLWDGDADEDRYRPTPEPAFHVVAVDFGAKHAILRNLSHRGCRVTVVPAAARAEEILERRPDGVFLANGPGDPAATGRYAVPEVRRLVDSGIPVFGICLGHQLMALALGARTEKMHMGHRGGNHPVRHIGTGKVEITSQNHGFVVAEDTLPAGADVTHRSLFDGTIEGFRLRDRPVFAVQYHPESSPGPHDSGYLFDDFVRLMRGAD